MKIAVILFLVIQSVLEALGSFDPVHPLILEILEWLFLLNCKQNVVQFCWVPARVGILDNGKADQLAKDGSLKQRTEKGIPHSDYIPGIRESINFTWQFTWNLELSNKMGEITRCVHPWVYSSISRRGETALCRLRIGHT